MQGLTTDLVLGGVRLAIRIGPKEKVPASLAELQSELLNSCARWANGEPVSIGKRHFGGTNDSFLEIVVEVGPGELFALATELASLAHALDQGAQPSEESRQDKGFRYLKREPRARVFHRDFWLFRMWQSRPELLKRLENAGIHSDSDWRERESGLEADLRLEVEKGHRFDFARRAAGVRQMGSEVVLSRLCALVPPWLVMDHPVLLERIPDLRILLASGVSSFDELSRLKESDLEQAGFDRAGRRQLALALGETLPELFGDLIWQNIAGPPASEKGEVSPKHFDALHKLVAWMLAQLSPGAGSKGAGLEATRDRQRILARRIGEPLIAGFGSLQEITPDVFHGTVNSGERTRQFQMQVISELKGNPKVASLLETLEQAINTEMRRRDGVLPLGPGCPIPALVTTDNRAVERFLKLFFRDGRLARYRLTEDGSSLFKVDSQDSRDKVIVNLLEIVRSSKAAEQRLWPSIMPRLKSVTGSLSSSARRAIDRCFFATLNWSEAPSAANARLVSRGDSSAAVVVAVLAREGRAMARAELVKACARPPFRLSIKASTLGNVLTTLTADPWHESNPDVFEAVFQVDTGLYACQADLPLAIETARPLAVRAAELVRDGRRSIRHDPQYGDRFQWHCADLVESLQASGHGDELAPFDDRQRWHLLDAVLRYHRPEGVVNLHKGYWMAQVPDLPPDRHEKVDQNDVVEWVLENFAEGQAMPIAEVREQVARVQSLGPTGQLQAASRIPEDRRMEKVGRGLLRLKP